MIDGSMHVCAQLNTGYVCAHMSVQLSLFCVLCTCRYRGQAAISRGCSAGCLARNSFLCQSGIALKVYPSPVLSPAHMPMNSPNLPSTHSLTHAPILPPSISTSTYCPPPDQLMFSQFSMHPSTVLYPLPTHHPPAYPPTYLLTYPSIHPPSTHPSIQHPPTIH